MTGRSGEIKASAGIVSSNLTHDLLHVLIAHKADYYMLAAVQPRYLRRQIVPSPRVVTCIAHPQRLVAKLHPSAGQTGQAAHIGKAFLHSVIRKPEAEPAESFNGRQHRVGIGMLIAAAQLTRNGAEAARGIYFRHSAPVGHGLGDFTVGIGITYRSVHLRSLAGKHLTHGA